MFCQSLGLFLENIPTLSGNFDSVKDEESGVTIVVVTPGCQIQESQGLRLKLVQMISNSTI